MRCLTIATMISEIYTALLDAGVTEEKARLAAEALSAENLATKQDVNELKGEVRLLKWMLGIVIAAQVVPLLKALGVV